MTILSMVLLAWTAACWFSQPFDKPFLNSPVFGVDAIIPLIASISCLGIALLVWALRSGRSTLSRASAWIRQNVGIAVLLASILVLHILIELPPILWHQGANDADSALYGIAGYRIAEGTMRPMFNVGKHHMGSLVPHITAVFNAGFGKSPIYLRIVNSAFYLGFLVMLFLLTRRILKDDRPALIAALLAAIPPKEVFKFLKHPESATVLFLGTLAIYLLLRILQENKVGFRRYFVLGTVLGLGFWVHYQFVYYIIFVVITLFIKDKLVFVRPQITGLISGSALGAIVLIIDGFYYNWPMKGLGSELTVGVLDFFSRLPAGMGQFFKHIPTFLGVRADYSDSLYYSNDIFGAWITWLVMALFILCFAVYAYYCRKELGDIIKGKNVIPGPSIILIFSFVIFLVFALTRGSYPNSPMRYVYPLWTSVVVIIAFAIDRLPRWKYLPRMAFATFFAALFMFSNFLEDTIIHLREGWHQEWVDFCRANGINRFYGPWLRTHWTSFVTAEEIVGSSSYPLQWHPFVAYQRLVDHSGTYPAYLFDETGTYSIRMLKERLADVGISYAQAGTHFGPVFYNFSEKVTPKQFVNLEPGKYLADFDEVKVLGGTESLPHFRIVEVKVTNSGENTWYPDARNGFVELSLRDSDGPELRRLPLHQTVEPGGSYVWKTIIAQEESSSGDILAQVTVNDLLINRHKQPNRISLASRDTRLPIEDQLINALYADGSEKGRLFEEYMLFSGWGMVITDQKEKICWSGGSESMIGFLVKKQKAKRILIEMRPFKGGNMPPGAQRVKLLLNGHELGGPIELLKRRKVVIDIPADFLRAGINRLTFRYRNIEPEFSPIMRTRDPRFRLRPRAIALLKVQLKRPARKKNPEKRGTR